LSEERLKIAVFIDFDNIEIGVKKTLNRHFDVGQVLEAVKERGEVVTKIAYGDWKQAADYSRAMTQHAVQMVQRNLTPGGDKNGADITLALDALEMAFTKSHINAFVIVGGDSDFIALVEKLKQYDKMVFVVGGRSFTSSILQKNCHEFIAYENLIGMQPVIRKSTGRAPAVSPAHLGDALHPLRRALEILADREVSPQLGLLKSTLLQLDSTFSERDYGARSFREFIQKMANAGFVNLKQVDRSLLVELKDSDSAAVVAVQPDIKEETASGNTRHSSHTQWGESSQAHRREVSSPSGNQEPPDAIEAVPAPSSGPAPQPQAAGAVSVVRRIFEQARSKPHWPMYLRSFKHFLRSVDPSFDERQLGISHIHDLARMAQREGLLRIERNHQGILRIYPGEQFPQTDQPKPHTDVEEAPPAGASMPEVVESSGADLEPLPEPAVEAQSEIPVHIPPDEPHKDEAGLRSEEKPKRQRAATASTPARGRRTTAKRPRVSRKTSKAEHSSSE